MGAEQMVTSLELVYRECATKFGDSNPGRLQQLRSALDTAQMAVDYLFTEVPFIYGA